MKQTSEKITVRVLALVIAVAALFCMTSCGSKKKVPIYKNEAPTNKKPVPTTEATEKPDPSIGEKYIAVVFDDETMTIKNTHQDVVLEYKDIEGYTYMQQLEYEYDSLKEGNNTPSMICGLMQEAEGEESEYYLYIYKSTENYISIEYRGRLYIFNLESNDATSTCYDTIKERMIKSTERK